MAPFEELQELWQSQPEQAAVAFDVRGLTQQLQRFGRNQTWINRIKVAAMAILFSRLVIRLYTSPMALCGIVLLFTGLVAYVVLDWRNQIGISRLDFSAPSVEFVRKARARLQHQLNPMHRIFWMLVICVGGGLNLLLAARSGNSLSERVYEHLGAIALPFAAYAMAERIRRFRFRRECGAVLERVEALIRTMEDHQR